MFYINKTKESMAGTNKAEGVTLPCCTQRPSDFPGASPRCQPAGVRSRHRYGGGGDFRVQGLSRGRLPRTGPVCLHCVRSQTSSSACTSSSWFVHIRLHDMGTQLPHQHLLPGWAIPVSVPVVGELLRCFMLSVITELANFHKWQEKNQSTKNHSSIADFFLN